MNVNPNQSSAQQLWNEVQWKVVAPAILEAKTILQSGNENPGWNGSQRLGRNAQVIEIHDFRRPFSIWDTWGWWGGSRVTNVTHNHYYASSTSISRAEKAEEEKKQNDAVNTMIRVVVGVVAVVGIYFTSKSLGYALGQYHSASSKLNEMHSLVDKVFDDEKMKQALDNNVSKLWNRDSNVNHLKNVSYHRSYLLNDAKRRNFHDVVSYVGIVAGLSLLGVSAVFASYTTGIAGAVVGTASLIYWAFSHSYIEAVQDDAQRKRNAQVVLDYAQKLAKVEIKDSSEAPVVNDNEEIQPEQPKSMYPDLGSFEYELNIRYRQENPKYAPSAPPL